MMVARKLPEIWHTLRRLDRGVRQLRTRLNSYQLQQTIEPSTEA
jgi:hypothetical protein